MFGMGGVSVEELLARPESKTLEFKRDLSSLKPILRTIVAFANTAGGVLIIGYSPEDGLVGLSDVLAAEESLSNTINDSITPSIYPEIDVKSVKGQDLLIVSVPFQKGPFYLRSEGAESGVYLRLGSTTRKAGVEGITDLKRHTNSLSFDQLPCADLSESDLDPSRINQFLQRIDKVAAGELVLKSLGILTIQGTDAVPSNAGVILFGRDDVRRQYFPDACIFCARFKGVDKTQFIDRLNLDGSLVESVEQVVSFIKRNTMLAGIIQGLVREDIPEYPEIPLREVLINALVHANYSMPGKIYVAIYDDRLEIQSPGMFPYGMSLDDFKQGVSHIRNRVIARVFRELGLVEEWGSCYNRVVSYCANNGYPAPEWQELGSAIRVIFRRHETFVVPDVQANTLINTENGTINTENGTINTENGTINTENGTINTENGIDFIALKYEQYGLSHRQTKILDAIMRNEIVDVQTLVNELLIPRRTVLRDLAHLKMLNIIQYVGSKKTGRYVLVDVTKNT